MLKRQEEPLESFFAHAVQVKLSCDQCGNFVVQKLLEHGGPEKHAAMLKQVKGHVPQMQTRTEQFSLSIRTGVLNGWALVYRELPDPFDPLRGAASLLQE